MHSHHESMLSRRRRWRALAGLAAFIFLAPGASATVVNPGAPANGVWDVLSSADACLDSEEIAFLGLINDHRAMAGLGPLSVSSSLSAASAYHSIDMAEKAYLDHTMIDGTSVQQNMQNFGYQGGAYGENIAAGTSGASEAMNIWQNSPEHNANMLNSSFGAIGIGRAYDDASPHGWYWTTIFGDVNDGPGWVCGEAPPPSKTASLFQSVDSGTSSSDVNLRSGPGESFQLVNTLPANTPMTITGGEILGYLPVKVDGQFGWIGADWMSRGPVELQQTANSIAATGAPGTATVVQPTELLAGPDEAAGMISSLPAVSQVDLTGQAQNGFLQVSFNGQTGWADAAYLQVADTGGDAQLLQAADSTVAPQPVDNTVQEPGALQGEQALTTTNVNLRSQPSASSMVLDVVPAGSEVSLTGSRANGYVNVRIAGQAGWIDEEYLQ
ncbi:MAG: SH3 domain-containing protein [Thermomicrobiales bacterium]|nr:SH3 domain-containing protein [Thermomicrobiales bacterium]